MHSSLVKVKCLDLYWLTISTIWTIFPGSPVKATPHGSSVTTGGNRSTRRKPAMLGRVKLDNTLLTCDQGNFNQITARSRNRALVTVVRHVHYHCATSTSAVEGPVGGPAMFKSLHGCVWQRGSRVKTQMASCRHYAGAKTITWMLFEVEFLMY